MLNARTAVSVDHPRRPDEADPSCGPDHGRQPADSNPTRRHRTPSAANHVPRLRAGVPSLVSTFLAGRFPEPPPRGRPRAKGSAANCRAGESKCLAPRGPDVTCSASRG